MSDFSKDILTGLIFLIRLLGFTLGEFIILSALFAIAAIASNVNLNRKRVNTKAVLCSPAKIAQGEPAGEVVDRKAYQDRPVRCAGGLCRPLIETSRPVWRQNYLRWIVITTSLTNKQLNTCVYVKSLTERG
jgi:hypothetical protein